MSPPTRRRRPSPPPEKALLAAALSLLFPGTGQLYAGRRRRAYVFLAITGIALIVAVYFLARGKLYLLKLSVQPNWMLTLLVAIVFLAAFHLFAIFDAFRSVRAIRPRTTIGTLAVLAGLAFLLIGTALPHVAAGRRAWLQYDLITSVFADEEPTVVAGSGSSTTPSTQPASDSAPGDGSTSSTTTSSTTTTTLAPLWEEGERLNVLLLGGDAGVGRTSVRTDTMIVVSVDPNTGDAAMLSVPRNLYRLPFPPGPAADEYPDGFTDLSNAIYRYGAEHPEMFPGAVDTGAAAIKGAIGELMGITVHYFLMVNLDGFVEVIDAIGGVDMRVEDRVYDAEYPHEDGSTVVIDIEPGVHHFDGHMALAYARSRRASDDYNRMGRQRCVLEAVAEQADVIRLLLAFPTLVPVIKDSVVTDIPISRLPDLIELLEDFDTDDMVTVRFIPPRFATSSRPNFEEIRYTVETIMTLPPAEAIEVLNLQSLDDACPSLVPEPEPTSTTTTTAAGTSG